MDLAAPYENWLRTHADTQDTGCNPVLPANATCPKWHTNQPEALLSAAGDVAEQDPPNCYLCCSARSGFGCDATTPSDTHGAIADVIPFDKNGKSPLCPLASLFLPPRLISSSSCSPPLSLSPLLSSRLWLFSWLTDLDVCVVCCCGRALAPHQQRAILCGSNVRVPHSAPRISHAQCRRKWARPMGKL